MVLAAIRSRAELGTFQDREEKNARVPPVKRASWMKSRISEISSGCWIRSSSDGKFINKRYTSCFGIASHKVIWRMFYGEIPRGLYVLHKCDQKACVNPKHLELGTAKKNIRDAHNRGLCLHSYRIARPSFWRWIKENGLNMGTFAKQVSVRPKTVKSWLYACKSPTETQLAKIAKSFPGCPILPGRLLSEVKKA